MKKPFVTAALVATAVVALLSMPKAAWSHEPPFTSVFQIEDCDFSTEGRNPYFSIEPGDELVLEGDDDGEALVLKITVLDRQKVIVLRTPDGETLRIKTRVVEERETVDDELVEVSRNFFARCEQTNDIFYFGEEVDIYEDGEIVSHDGAWRAGGGGARPGIIMPGRYLLGARYFQEIAPGVALDRGENTAMGLTITVPAGTFHDCVEVIETSPLDAPGHQSLKRYCPGIGLVKDGSAELAEFHLDDEDDD